MDSVDRLAQAKKLLCRSIMSATSPFDLAKSYGTQLVTEGDLSIAVMYERKGV